MTAPTGVPLRLLVLRPGEDRKNDQELEASRPAPLPVRSPEAPGASAGARPGPSASLHLRPVGSSKLPDLRGSPHLLFFWATWCGPCKKAAPEVMALAESRGLPVVAITDEDLDKVSGFLKSRHEGFFPWVAIDPLRRSFVSHGISGTPTILLVDAEGVIRDRHVGYSPERGVGHRRLELVGSLNARFVSAAT